MTGTPPERESHPPIYTIGHGNAPVADVIALLRAHEIAILVDVRSIPASRYVPQFNRVAFTDTLVHAGIGYFYAGNALGGRPTDPQMYRNGVVPQGRANYLKLVDYAKVAAQPRYQNAVADLVALARVRRTAIMCSEEDPRQCHRLHLIARTLLGTGIPVYHLRHRGPMEIAPFELVTVYQGGNE